MRYCIFHADDFGLTESINRGIITAYKKGVVKSTSLVASGKAFAHAVSLARENPALDVGMHLTLVEEACVSNPLKIPSLVNSKGLFRKNYLSFAKDYLAGKIKLAEVEIEMENQLKKCLDTSLKITHIDSHQHLHVLPGILHRLYRLAERYDIPFIRTRIEPNVNHQRYGFEIVKRNLLLRFLHLLSTFSRITIPPPLRGRGEVRCYGFLYSGRITADCLAEILSAAHDDSEIMLHPGFSNDDTLERYGYWNYKWEQELNVLVSEELMHLLARCNIKPVSFKQISESRYGRKAE